MSYSLKIEKKHGKTDQNDNNIQWRQVQYYGNNLLNIVAK